MTYDITAEIVEGEGLITPQAVVTYPEESDATYVITAHDGWGVRDVLVDGVSVGTVTEYEFTNIQDNHTIKALFRKTFAHTDITPIILLKIHRENGAIQYATVGTSTDEGAYLEKLIPSGQMNRSFDILGYSFQSNRASIQIQNADNSFLKLLNDNKLYGSMVEIYAGIEGMNLDEFHLTFTGRVLERKIEDNKGILTFYDVRPNLPKLPYSVLEATGFENLASDLVGKSVPFIAGYVAQSKGAVELVKIDSKKYMIASGRALEITKLYLNGVGVPSTDATYPWNFTSVARADSFGFHSFVTFTGATDPVDDSKVVTANVSGWGYDYLRLKEFTQVTSGGQTEVDSYGLNLNGSDELAWVNSGFWTAGTSFTIQTRIKPGSFPSSGDVTICAQEQLFQGGKRGIRLFIGSDRKVRLAIAKNGQNSVNLLESSTVISDARYTKIKATFDYATGRARLYFDTGSGFVQVASDTYTDFDPYVVAKMSVGAVWKNDEVPELQGWIEHFHGIIDYLRFSNIAQINSNDITNVTREWIFYLNLNDSSGAGQHLDGVQITSPEDYAVVDSHQEDQLLDTYYPTLRIDSGQDSIYSWQTTKKVTFGWRFRTPGTFEWCATNGFPEEYYYFLSRIETIFFRYNIESRWTTLRLYDGSSWAYQPIGLKLDANPLATDGEWSELYITIDYAKGYSKIILNDKVLAEGAFTPHTPYFPENFHMFIAGSVGAGSPHPKKLDIDWFGIAHEYVGDRRYARPADSEWKVFIDFAKATGTELEYPGCSLTSFNSTVIADSNGAENGGTGIVKRGEYVTDSHYYDSELMTGAECIMEALHILQEPCEYGSFRSVNSVLEALGVNYEGQFGGLVTGSARQILRDMQSSLDVQLWQGRDARWKLGYHQRDSQAFNANHFSFDENIESTGWKYSFQSDLKNERRVVWQKSLREGENIEFHKSGSIKLETSTIPEQLGEKYQDESDLQLLFCRGDALAAHTAKSAIRKQASELPVVEFNSSLVALQKKPPSLKPQTIGDIIEVTHPRGPGGPAEYSLRFDGTGTDRIFGNNKAWPGSTSFTIQIKGVKMSTASSCWWAKSDDATPANRNFLVFWNDEDKRIAIGISNSLDYEGHVASLDSYTNVGDTVVVKATYNLATKRIHVYQGSNEMSLVEALDWNTGKTLNSYNALEGIGSRNASDTTYATCDRIDYVKIAYNSQENTDPISNSTVTFYPLEVGKPFISEERNLLLLPQSTKKPEVVKVKNAGCSRKKFYISDLGFDYGTGRTSIKAVSMEDLLDGGIFSIDSDDPTETPPPPGEHLYRTYVCPATLKHREWMWDSCLAVFVPIDYGSKYKHGSDKKLAYGPENEYEYRGQMDINLWDKDSERRISDSEGIYLAYLDISCSVGSNLEKIKIQIRTTDVTNLTYEDIDAGIGSFCGSTDSPSNENINPTIELNTTAFDYIYENRNGSVSFTNQPIPKSSDDRWIEIESATLTIKTKEILE